MSKFSNEEDADNLKGQDHVPHNGVDDEDDDDMDDTFVDKDGRFDLSRALPNSSADNPFEYMYTRDHSGRVMMLSVVCSLKEPKAQVQTTESRTRLVRWFMVRAKSKRKQEKTTKLVLTDLQPTDGDNEKKK